MKYNFIKTDTISSQVLFKFETKVITFYKLEI